MYQKGIKIICRTCKELFLPKSSRNIFCCRKCFKKDFAKRIQDGDKKFPSFNCPKCGQHIELDFDPALKSSHWLQFKCPGCNVLMINVGEDIKTEDTPL